MYLFKVAIAALLGLYFGISAPAWAELGFAPVAEANAPDAVKQAAFKVLQLWTPAGFTIRPAILYAGIRRSLGSQTVTDLRTRIRIKINLEELDLCEAQKRPQCVFSEIISEGSAFVLEDGTLYAAHHDFSQGTTGLTPKFLAMAQDWNERMNDPDQHSRVEQEVASFKANPLQNVIFFLTDAAGNVVFNSGKQQYRFLRFGNVTSFQGLVDLAAGKASIAGVERALENSNFLGSRWVNQDSVRIQISAALPRLQSTSENCGPGARTYVAGFAGDNTKTRAALGARDAVFEELSLSRGVSLRPDQIFDRATAWSKAASYVAEINGQPSLLTDADGAGGMSGGPILNDQGKVCGLFKAFFPEGGDIRFNAKANVFELISFGIPIEILTGN
ncbi:MAG: hypothetical protein ACXVA9_00470 [Bdellovibrionales bacterium]